MVCHWDEGGAWTNLGSAAGSVHPVRAGQVVAQRAGTWVADAFRGGPDGLTLLAYGRRRRGDIAFHPRSSKVYLRGAGIVIRVAGADHWDGEE